MVQRRDYELFLNKKANKYTRQVMSVNVPGKHCPVELSKNRHTYCPKTGLNVFHRNITGYNF